VGAYDYEFDRVICTVCFYRMQEDYMNEQELEEDEENRFFERLLQIMEEDF
jgi:hypothetical protein